MIRTSYTLALVLAAASATFIAASPANAQPAFALGHPLPAPDFAVGTLSVRVIAGSPAKPVIGTEVTLIVDGAPRTARTDSAGRAFFKELTAGASVQAVIKDADGKDVESDTFPMPAEGGMHVMLSTLPMESGGGAGGAPFAPFAGGGGGAGMPQPRVISGTPRPEQKNAAGTLTVRVVYDDLKDKNPNIPVTLVAYDTEGGIHVVVKQTDADGRATFPDLDVSSSTAYYAMAQVPRNGTFDRLVSTPIVLESQVGVALLLSSEKQDSTKPLVDDQSRLDPQDADVPAGKVKISLDGDTNAANQVDLYDAVTHAVVAHVLPERGPPDPTDINASAHYEAHADAKPGTFDLAVHGGPGTTDKPIAGIAVSVFAMEDTQMSTPFPGVTNASGVAHFDLKPGAYHAQLVINGKELGSNPLDLTAGGGELAVTAQWDAVGRPRAMLDVVAKPGQTLYAETRGRTGTIFRSAPFQLLTDRGTTASIRAVPVFYTFHIVTGIEDELLAVQGQFQLMNFSWAPYKAGPDGLDIPLPRGFKGAQIAERDQAVAAIAAGIGFRIPRPLAPAGPTVFHAGYSLPIHRGEIEWAQDLPLGTVESWIRMEPQPNMIVELPKGTPGGLVDTDNGPIYNIPRITINPGQSMVLTIRGLPTAPAWKVWLPRIIGIAVIVVMLGGIAFAMTRPSTRTVVDPAREARRTRLLEELVELERSGKDAKRRESLLVELEKLWDDAAA